MYPISNQKRNLLYLWSYLFPVFRCDHEIGKLCTKHCITMFELNHLSFRRLSIWRGSRRGKSSICIQLYFLSIEKKTSLQLWYGFPILDIAEQGRKTLLVFHHYILQTNLIQTIFIANHVTVLISFLLQSKQSRPNLLCAFCVELLLQNLPNRSFSAVSSVLEIPSFFYLIVYI